MTYVEVEVENLFTKRTLPVKALVDPGAVFFTVPEHIAVQLGLDLTEVGTREVVLANGHRPTCSNDRSVAGQIRRPVLRSFRTGAGR